MDQQQIAIELQIIADEYAFENCNDLAKKCYELGASYKVLAWVDSYCLSRNLYKPNDDFSEVGK